MKAFNKDNQDVAWCPGCGNYLILNILKDVLTELSLPVESTVLVSGIGQAAKLPQYINCNFFNGLHGRALPVATAIKVSNKNLNVIVTSGDGDIYGEGGNHFMHAIRKNPNITVLVHDNMVYGLTKGQASPTASSDYSTKTQPKGNEMEPFNPLATAIALNASFVGRVFCQDIQQSKEIIKEAILHKGFSIVDVFQPCVVFNKINTYKWFKENTYYLEEEYNPDNRIRAFERSIETEKLPLGIFYKNDRVTLEETASNINKTQKPLYQHSVDRKSDIENLVRKYL